MLRAVPRLSSAWLSRPAGAKFNRLWGEQKGKAPTNFLAAKNVGSYKRHDSTTPSCYEHVQSFFFLLVFFARDKDASTPSLERKGHKKNKRAKQMFGPSHGEAAGIGPLEAQPVRITTCETAYCIQCLWYSLCACACFSLSNFYYYSFLSFYACVYVSCLCRIPFLGR